VDRVSSEGSKLAGNATLFRSLRKGQTEEFWKGLVRLRFWTIKSEIMYTLGLHTVMCIGTKAIRTSPVKLLTLS